MRSDHFVCTFFVHPLKIKLVSNLTFFFINLTNSALNTFIRTNQGFGSAFILADPGKNLHADPDSDPGGKGKK